jgi:integrase
MSTTETSQPSRRTKVKGKPGIYYRETPKGRRYEITYLDSDGRRRWKTVEGFDNLADADDLLLKIKQEKKKGARLVSSRLTFSQLVEQYQQRERRTLGERSRELYDSNLRLHLLPALGPKRVSDITSEDVARLVEKLEGEGLSAWTIRNCLTTLNSVYRSMRLASPVRDLTRDERPASPERTKRVLSPDELENLLRAATTDRYRVLLATAAYSGLRLMELLGLTWDNIDLDEQVIRVRGQLRRDRTGDRIAPLKTRAANRDVAIGDKLTALLKKHKMASRYKDARRPVFATQEGEFMSRRNVQRRALEAAAEGAKLEGVRFHDLRHTFASLLIGYGLDVVNVSKQLGHANPAITLKVYADEFDRSKNQDQVRAALDGSTKGDLGNLLETSARSRAKVRPLKTAISSQ